MMSSASSTTLSVMRHREQKKPSTHLIEMRVGGCGENFWGIGFLHRLPMGLHLPKDQQPLAADASRNV